jgi:Flp pilus assembly protein TadG
MVTCAWMKNRRTRGYGMIELAAGAVFFVIISVLSVNMIVLMIADSVVDRAARDAARAAASQSTAEKAKNSARAVLFAHKTDGYFISQPRLTSTASPDFVYYDNDGNPNINAPPYPFVTVTVIGTARLPAVISVFGAVFNSSGGGGITARGVPGTMDFKRRVTAPILSFQLAPEFD